ncbi:MAG: hypothetical protein ACKVY0_26420 [Prosthecobacter sp.]|uniref:hypothetical protein n=1 Tax=Prosthecobacter sp. TaxID=1965333 RepID=UPI00390193F1
MYLTRLPVFLVSVSLALTSALQPAIAGEAFFSKDGKTVTMGLNNALTGLVQVDIATGKITKAPLPTDLKDEGIDSVARGGEGEALFLAKDAVWVWTPKVVKRIYPTSPVMGATDLFVATQPGTPLTDCLFVSGNETADANSMGSFYGRKPGSKSKAFVSVFCRRVSDATGGVFSDDGRLFFISSGDLWEGGIQVDDVPGMERLGTLVGARIAPLAISNTDEANGGGLWVNHIAPAGNWIYVQLRGRHMATLLRTPMPAKPLYAPGEGDFPTVKNQLDAMTHSLTKTQIIADDLGDVFGFCATEVAGKPRVFYCTRTEAEGKGPAMLLWEGAGQARIIGYLPTE